MTLISWEFHIQGRILISLRRTIYVCLAEIVGWEPSFWKKLGEIDTKAV
ncbi:hypothetical protein LEP1GSC068_0690 [Leptospira sp. Fiocruz LV3954]|nr:hypothetical protein LEP1GSC068_0690 [Leptospira sp. Fiocruz LV3954]EMI64960.1 hypothetical protein LEP1GSC076_0973 [Leptospira sp. Fiocruz LV4135]